MANTYQANNFTGKQLDDFMGKVLDKSLAGQGLVFDDRGVMHASNPNYGKKIFSYTHTSNQEVHPIGVNLATGEFTAQAHGLTNGTVVVAVVNEPYHVGYPYRYLPGGLLLGQTNGSGRISQYYYVSVVDENTFTLSTTNGGATVTFTEVSTMDLSKFHFEVHKKMDLVIRDLPNLKELLVVIKGRMSMGYRYCMPHDERASESGKLGVVAFDSSTSADQWGSLWLGNTGGWNSAYIEVEMKFVEDRHVLVIADQDYLSFKSNSEIPVAFHVRGYLHIYMNRDDMTSIGITDGAFINGSTVEVYSK